MPGKVLVLSGPRGAGKSTYCLQIVDAARKKGLHAAGVICPAQVVDGHKVGFEVLDVQTGERRPLADVNQAPARLRTPAYRFFPEAMAWGAELIKAAVPCTLLIIDELGPLELVQRQGWTVALDVLNAGQYKLAVVVVRPELVGLFDQQIDGHRQGTMTLPLRPGENPVSTVLDQLTLQV